MTRTAKLEHILYIEDDAGLAQLLQRRMARQHFNIEVAYTGSEGIARVQQKTYDLVLLDYYLPDMRGLEAMAKIAALPGAPPVIILTTSGDEKIALQALENGAADYAVKDTGQFYLDLLPAIMQAAYTKDQLTRENEQQRQELAIARDRAEAANQAKSDFLAVVSHDIRTPMNAVTGIAQMLLQTPLSAQQQEMTRTLLTNADMLLKLVSDLLDMSRIESGQIELESVTFTIGQLAHELHAVFDQLAGDKGLAFSINDHCPDLLFTGDRARIQQILVNLIGNALKFTATGSITLTATAESLPGGKSLLHIAVTDTGVGIAPEKQAQIFRKFVQEDRSIARRYGGSGLGLNISKSLTELMQGEITVHSVPGDGATFTVTLPLPSTVRTTIAAATVAGDSTAGLVLVVEDYPANVMVATMMLENLGYEVDVANCGTEAVAKVRASARPYTAILMDVQMQDMDGLEATRQIRQVERERGQRHYIIGVTAHALAGDRDLCIAAGMDQYMSKPIHPDLLEQNLNHLTGKTA